MKINIIMTKYNRALLKYHSPKVRTLKPAKPNMIIGPHID